MHLACKKLMTCATIPGGSLPGQTEEETEWDQ